MKIIIIGGGIVGLTLAACLVKSNCDISIDIVEAQAFDTALSNELDAWVSSINMASYWLLHRLGVWSDLPQDSYTPLQRMVVWDRSGGGEIHFNASDVDVSQMGFIVRNKALRYVLQRQLAECANVRFYCPSKPVRLNYSPAKVELSLDCGQQLGADLVVGADGGQSWLRQQMGVTVSERSYDQQAMIGVVELRQPHQQVAFQHFLPTGPIGLLPLAQFNQAVYIWSIAKANWADGFDSSIAQFNDALAPHASVMRLLTTTRSMPLCLRQAKNYVKPRLVLIGDAAHSIHPLAGQGLNLGLMDAAALAEVIEQDQQKRYGNGHFRTLRRYERWRKGDNQLMSAAMTAFHYTFTSQSKPIIMLRNTGFKAANQLPLLKRFFIDYAMGLRNSLPALARSEQ